MRARALEFAPRIVPKKAYGSTISRICSGRVAKQRPRGDQNKLTKYSDDVVRRIRALHVPNRRGPKKIQRLLAAEGIEVNYHTIHRILKGEAREYVH